MTKDNVSAALGTAAGAVLAPLTAFGSAVRRSRLFHPTGTVLLGRAVPSANHGPYTALGSWLEGDVLVRFSGAWWKKREWRDVLGCAIRFRATGAGGIGPSPGDQDLLFATIRNPLSLPLAPLTTNVTDYLANRYYGVSPFTPTGGARVKLRVTPEEIPTAVSGRDRKLAALLATGPIRFVIEAREDRLGAEYFAFARIELDEALENDPDDLHFDPFLNGRGLVPAGFVQHIRTLAYGASQRARVAVGH